MVDIYVISVVGIPWHVIDITIILHVLSIVALNCFFFIFNKSHINIYVYNLCGIIIIMSQND